MSDIFMFSASWIIRQSSIRTLEMTTSAKFYMLALTALFCCLNVLELASGSDVYVDVPELGTIKGKLRSTKGNLNHIPRQFSSFKNIPFAESVVGAKRFTVSSHVIKRLRFMN